MAAYSLNEVIRKKMLKRRDGRPYSRSQAMHYLLSGGGFANLHFFPNARRVAHHRGYKWQFTQEDIDAFNNHSYQLCDRCGRFENEDCIRVIGDQTLCAGCQEEK